MQDQPALTTISEQLETISGQQESICMMLNEIIGVLNQESESSLIDELAELFEPLFSDIQDIKERLPVSESEV